jgi:hypothetical protein
MSSHRHHLQAEHREHMGNLYVPMLRIGVCMYCVEMGASCARLTLPSDQQCTNCVSSFVAPRRLPDKQRTSH